MPIVDDQDRHIMSASSLTKRNPDPHWFLTGNGAAWFKPTNQQPTALAKSSLDRHSDRPPVPQTPPASAQQPLRPHRPTATMLAAVKSP
jgi:hypothetical protein